MRRAALALSLLAALIPLTVAHAESGAFTKTKVVTISPVDASGHPKPGYKVVERAAKGTCESGSDVLAGAYRCFTGKYVADPCWPDTATTPASVVCTQTPWGTKLFQIVKPTGLKPYAKKASPGAMGLMLTSGAHCDIIETGGSAFHGTPIRYACNGTSGLLGEPTRNAGLWTIRRVRYDARRNTMVADGVVKIAVYYQGRSIVWK